MHIAFRLKLLNEDRSTKIHTSTHIFLIGKDSSNPFTDEKGTTVCCAGLFIALACLASIC
jgi:dihydroorotase